MDNGVILIDGDIVAYRCAASCEPTKTKEELEPLQLAIERLDELMWKIINTCDMENYRVFLSGGDNFRKIIYPAYKENRKDMRIPVWLGDCQKYLIEHWNAELVVGMEADDAIGIAHKEGDIIASIDKDFMQIPGRHYNFVKDMLIDVTHEEAEFNFWKHILIGDRSDNVKGVEGIGEVKATKLLNSLPSELWPDEVVSKFTSHNDYVIAHRMIKILRSKEEYEDIIGEIYADSLEEGQRQIVTETGSGQDSENAQT